MEEPTAKIASQQIPKCFLCPISGKPMTDPVMTSEGQNFEKATILKWLEYQKTNPLLNDSPLDESQLYPNLILKDVIEGFFEEESIENSILCPIGYEIMTDPVMTPEGQSFERENIFKWLRDNKEINPVTRSPLTEDQLFPNAALKDAIVEYEKIRIFKNCMLLIKEPHLLSVPNQDKKVPIEVYADQGNFEIVKLIAENIKTDKKDTLHYGSALLTVIKNNAADTDAVEALLKASAGNNKTWHFTDTDNHALHLAVLGGNAKIVNLLLNYNFPLDKQNKAGKTPIELAAKRGHFDIVKLIVEKTPTDENDTLHYGSALLIAMKQVSKNFPLAIEALLALLNTAPCNNRDYILKVFGCLNNDNKTLIEDYADQGNFEIVKFIAENIKTDENDTLHYGHALLAAIKARKTDVIETLLKAGAGIDKQNKDKQTPIQLAATKGYFDIVKLIAENLSTNENDTFHYGSALLIAAKADNINVVEVLLKAGAGRAWSYNATGDQALHCAALNGNTKTVSLLLDFKFLLDGQNKDKKTPIELAAEQGHFNIVKLIVEKTQTDENDTLHYGSALLIVLEKASENIHQAAEAFLALLNAPPCNNRDYIVKAFGCLNNDNKTLIEDYADQGNFEIVKFIAENIKTDENDTLHYGHALLAAIKARKTDVIETLLKAGAGIDKQNKDKQTPIQLAATKGYFDIVKLIAENLSTNENDTFHYGSALLNAAKADNINAVEALLKAGAGSHGGGWYHNATGHKALHYAALNGNPKMVNLLLDFKFSLDVQNNDKKTPIELAAKQGHFNIVKLIVEKIQTDENDTLHYGSALLIVIKKTHKYKNFPRAIEALLALLNTAPCNNRDYIVKAFGCLNNDNKTLIEDYADQGNFEIVKFIAENIKTDENDTLRYGSALLDAVKAGNIDAAEALLNAGAGIDMQNKDKHTPIQLAATKGYFNIVKLIAEQISTDENDTFHYGSALVSAVRVDNIDVVKVLLTAGAGDKRRWFYSDTGDAALHCAALNGNPKMVNLLLDFKFSLDVQNNDKKTPIELAAEQGHFDLVKLIAEKISTDENDTLHYGSALLIVINNTADADVVEALLKAHAGNNKNWNYPNTKSYALHLAVLGNNAKIVNLLLYHNFPLDVENNDKITPIELAAKKGLFDIVKLMAEKIKINSTISSSDESDSSTEENDSSSEENDSSSEENDSTSDKNDLDINDYDACHYSSALLIAIAESPNNYPQAAEAVSALLDAGAGILAAYTAIFKNDLKSISLLLGYKIPFVTVPKNCYPTPIEFAASLNKFEIVKLIAEKIKTDENDTWRYASALRISIGQLGKHNSPVLSAVWALLNAGACNNKDYIINKVGENCIHRKKPIEWAAEQGHFEIVKFIAEKIKTDEHDTLHYGSALLDAVNTYNLDAVKVLLEAGASNKWTSNGNDALHCAVLNGNAKIVNLLLDYNFPLDEQNKDKKTPIELAAEEGHFDIVKLIGEKTQTDENDTLHYGSALLIIIKQIYKHKNFPRAIEALLALLNTAPCNNREYIVKAFGCLNNDKTLIEDYANQGNFEIVKFIAENIKTDEDDSLHYGHALHIAVEQTRNNVPDAPEAVLALVKAGAGSFALYSAIFKKDDKMISALLDCDIPFNLPNKENKTRGVSGRTGKF